jgi:hypothetical protein
MKILNINDNYTRKGQRIVENLDLQIEKLLRKTKKRHNLSKKQMKTIALDVLGFRAKFPLN